MVSLGSLPGRWLLHRGFSHAHRFDHDLGLPRGYSDGQVAWESYVRGGTPDKRSASSLVIGVKTAQTPGVLGFDRWNFGGSWETMNFLMT